MRRGYKGQEWRVSKVAIRIVGGIEGVRGSCIHWGRVGRGRNVCRKTGTRISIHGERHLKGMRSRSRQVEVVRSGVIRRNLSRGVVPKETKSGFVFKNGLHDGVAIACGNTVTGYPLPLSSPNSMR
jgi:hypothetical protein